MTNSPLKEKRSAGGFFVVWRGFNGTVWIDEQYHLYKSNWHIFTRRDSFEMNKMREDHIRVSERIEIDEALYVIDFRGEFTDGEKLKVIELYHNGDTRSIDINE